MNMMISGYPPGVSAFVKVSFRVIRNIQVNYTSTAGRPTAEVAHLLRMFSIRLKKIIYLVNQRCRSCSMGVGFVYVGVRNNGSKLRVILCR